MNGRLQQLEDTDILLLEARARLSFRVSVLSTVGDVFAIQITVSKPAFCRQKQTERPASDKKPAARPQQKPQAVKPAEPVQQKPAAEAAPKKPQAAAPSETPETKKPTEIRQAAPVQNNSARPQRQEQSGYNNNRGQNRQNNRDGRDSGRDNRGGDNRGNRDFRGGEKKISDRNGNNGQGRPNRDGNVRPDHRVKVVRHVRVMEMAVR